MKALLVLPVLLVAGCVRPTPVVDVAPVCRREEVTGFVDGELRRRALYAELVPASAAERTDPSGTVSQCAAYARGIEFDANVRGNRAAVPLFPVTYGVRRVAYGFVVEVAPVVAPPLIGFSPRP